ACPSLVSYGGHLERPPGVQYRRPAYPEVRDAAVFVGARLALRHNARNDRRTDRATAAPRELMIQLILYILCCACCSPTAVVLPGFRSRLKEPIIYEANVG